MSTMHTDTTSLFEAEFGPAGEEEKNAFLCEDINAQIGGILFALRHHRKMSQEDVAALMHASKEKVVKIESFGAQAKLRDILHYAHVMGYKAEINFFPIDANDAQMIKHRLDDVVDLMNKLGEMAGDDPDIQEGLRKTFLGNLMPMLSEVLPRIIEKLPKQQVSSDDAQRSLSVSIASDAPEPVNYAGEYVKA